MNKIIDGKILAEKHQRLLKKKLERLIKQPSVVSIVMGNDPASIKYTKMKQIKALEMGIDFEVVKIPEFISFKDLENLIKKLNSNENISGIMVQLPTPFDRDKTQIVLDLIDPNKDIDGLRSDTKFIPATTRGVVSILKAEKLLKSGKKIMVVGGVRGKMGTSLVKVLNDMGEKVEGVSKDDPDLLKKTKKSDVLISSTGTGGLIRSEMVKKGVILIDIGLGDFNSECLEKASKYTPKIGGVGPMTIISLMENIIDTVEFK